MSKKSLVLAGLIATSFIAAEAFGNMQNQQEKEEPRTPVEIDMSQLKAHVTIKKEGISRRVGGPDSRPACGLGRGSKKGIHGSGTAQINSVMGTMLENTSRSLPLTVPRFNLQTGIVGAPQNSRFRSPSFADNWRSITVTNKVTDVAGSKIIDLTMQDFIHKSVKQYSKNRAREGGLFGRKIDCWKNEWDEFAEKDTISGFMDITYEVPEKVQFIKVEVSDATGVFTKIDPNKNSSRLSLVNSIHDKVSMVAPTYAWYKANEEGRLKIRYNFGVYSHGVQKSGMNVTSKVKIKLTPVMLPPASSLNEVFDGLVYNLDDLDRLEDQMVVDLGSLISMFPYSAGSNSTAKVLDSKTLQEIREIQSELFDFAIRDTTGGRKSFTPTTKAMAAVFATKISEHLSDRLLSICRVKSKELTLTKQVVELPGYVYMTFYVQRILKRLEALEVKDVYEFAKALSQIEASELSFAQVAKDAELMNALAGQHDIYTVLVSAAGKPLRASFGEMRNLESESQGYFNNISQIQTILSLLNEGMKIEQGIQRKINRVKRSTIRNPGNDTFSSLGAWEDVQKLNELIDEIIKEVKVFAQSSMFSEITKTGFRESMLEIFKGVNLREVDFPEGTEIYTFYSPIFDYFFDKKRIDRINNEAKLCLRGELK